ncbi:MAG: PPOX class F420-dependent oxidoreductase [Dehalococcoidia bacterium]|nr:PPOX class F420-dependent oxidoreductase [Dehalococcoidia bacterium]
MSVFTDGELAYLREQRIGRLATVLPSGDPHVSPVGYRYNEDLDCLDIGGRNLADTQKFKDVARTGRAALVVDDVLPPWHARGVEIRGRAEALTPGHGGADALIRLFPERVVSWGIDTDSFVAQRRTVVADP